MKSLASAAGVSALLGITEPAVFGVNLKLKYPFVAALIGSAVASAYSTFYASFISFTRTAGLPGVIVIRPESMIQYMITLAIGFAITFVVTFVLAKSGEIKSKTKYNLNCFNFN